MNEQELLALAALMDKALEHLETLPYRAVEPLAAQACKLSSMLFGELDERDETGRDLD